MPETTQPHPWPSPRGPWPEYDGTDRIYDHGAHWCLAAAGHPDRNGGYPNPDIHVPWHECRSYATAYTDIRSDLDGIPLQLELYAAALFQFGQPRTDTGPQPARIILEHYPDTPTAANPDEAGGAVPAVAIRISLPLGEALLLARHLARLVDNLTTPPNIPAARTW